MDIGEISVTQIIREYGSILYLVSGVIVALSIIKPKIGLWLICFFIPISPSIIVGQTEVRDITLRFEDFIFLGTAFGWLLKGMKIPKDGYGYKVLRLIFLLAIFHTISTVLYFRFKAQIFFLLKYIQYWSYFLLAYSLLENKNDFKILLMAYFVGVSLALIYWVNEIGQGKIGNAVRFPFHHKFAGRENVGIFTFGIMAFSLPFALNSKGIKKIFFLVFFASAALVYFRTLSRASYLAGMAWITFTLLFLRRKDLFLVVLVIIAIIPFILPDYVIDRIRYTFTGEGGREVLGQIYLESSTTARIDRWKYFLFEQLPSNLIAAIFGFGILGVGLMDNQYLRTWGEAGTLGFITLLLILKRLWNLYLKVYRSLPPDDFFKPASVGMICWFVGILVHMIPANTLVILQTSEMFWLISGSIAALERIISKEKTEEEEENTSSEQQVEESSLQQS